MLNFDLLSFANALYVLGVLMICLAGIGASIVTYQVFNQTDDPRDEYSEDKPSLPPYEFEDWHYYDGEQPKVEDK